MTFRPAVTLSPASGPDPTPTPGAPSTAAPTAARTRRGRVLLAAPRGYCAGVDRAVVAVEKALELHGAPVYVRKQIVHNKHVVAGPSRRRGAIFVEETDEVPEGCAGGVLRARRVAGGARAGGRAASCRTIDATCPLVTKVHKEAVRFASDDYDILLIGHAGHEEVEGTPGRRHDTSPWSRAPTTCRASPFATPSAW